jgi:hypothetical protein
MSWWTGGGERGWAGAARNQARLRLVPRPKTSSVCAGNMDALGLRSQYAGGGYGSLAADAGFSGVSLTSLRERGDRLVTRYRGGDPFDI